MTDIKHLADTEISGPAWDNTTEYPSLESKELEDDLSKAEELIKEIESKTKNFSSWIEKAQSLTEEEANTSVTLAQSVFTLRESAKILCLNVDNFVSCELSVDGKNDTAKKLYSRISQILAKLEQAVNPMELFLILTTDEVFEKYLDSEKTSPDRFRMTHARKLRDHRLSLTEEDLMIGLSVDGFTSWATLYDNLSGSLTCKIKLKDGVKEVGLATASYMQDNPNEEVRKTAYDALNKSWQNHEEACSSVLNSLAGWRLETYKRRSTRKPMHFLDTPIHEARIKHDTLEAMMNAVKEFRPEARKANYLQAKVLGKQVLGPWDLLAPCPSKKEDKKIRFEEAIDLIADAFSATHPDMGSFIHMMAEKKWIEGRVGDTKRPGAYAEHFYKSRTPRVYMTYTGGMTSVMILAHELGHAFHYWQIRDLPFSEIDYPMTLAETASIFAETVVTNALIEKASSTEEKLKIRWNTAKDVESFLLNVTARFDFEKSLYEARTNSTLTPQEMKSLMEQAWKQWYGDSLSQMNPMFWASKLHFHLSEISFYNFPYTFGYLFALGVYAQREKLGDDFYPAYVALLRDTGRMTAEELAQKHLNADLTDKAFWNQSLSIVKRTIENFETVANDNLG